jgi:hypothetical protein
MMMMMMMMMWGTCWIAELGLFWCADGRSGLGAVGVVPIPCTIAID